ncbi:CD4-1 molecule [Pungitius pungitius]|uniref:CD4-1 molecule n=1 Tax=Pungitius pungitius TaxID=134920 RepID=UPI002E0F8502
MEMRNVCHSVFLLLAALTSFTGAVEVKYAQLGEPATIRPPGDDGLSKCYMYWQLKGKDPHINPLAWRSHLGGMGVSSDDQWKGRLSLSGDSLIIKDVQETDFQTIVFERTCGTKTSSTEYKLLKLTVSVNPSSALLPGDTLSLSCGAETLQGQKGPEIHWLNPWGETIGKGPQPLTLKVTSQDSGQWTCVFANENTAKVSVTVLDLSPALLHPQYTSKSWPLTVPCSLSANITWQQIKKDVQEVHWHFVPKSGLSRRLFSLSLEDPPTWKADRNSELCPVPDPKKGDLSLTRSQGSEEDQGDYVCTMRFKNGVSLNRTVHVEVLQITSSLGTEFVSGQQLNLTCSIGHPTPSDLQLKWVPPEQSSLSSLASDRHLAHFTIPQVGTGDGGKWRCELWRSDALLTSAEITLKIEPRLSSWMLVVICSVTVIVILLLILAFILYRRRQQRRTHLGRRFCKCKAPKPKGFYRT